MANPTLRYSTTTLTFRPGCIQPTVVRLLGHRRLKESSNGTIRTREVSNKKFKFLSIGVQQLHRSDEGSFSGWDSLETFLTSTVNFSEQVFILTDADGDIFPCRLWQGSVTSIERKKDVFEGQLLFRIETGGSGAFLFAADTFDEDPGNVGITAHTPDSGFILWEHNRPDDTLIKIDSAVGADWAYCVDTVPTMVRNTVDIVDDNFELHSKWKTDSVAGTTAQTFGLHVLRRGDTTPDAAPAFTNEAGLYVFYRGGDSDMTLEYMEIDDAKATAASGILASGIAWGGFGFGSPGRELRLAMAWPTVTVYDRAGGAGAWVKIRDVTLTLDLRDGDHRRMGFSGQRSASASSGWFLDDLQLYL